MIRYLTERKEWKFFGVLPKADRSLAIAWWVALVLRGVLPAVFAIATGVLVGAVRSGDSLSGALAVTGAVFILLQILSPIHQAISANLGDRTAAWLFDRLTEACVRPPGMGHLEDPALTSDLTVARDFDLGMTGPPLSISMDFIASGMVAMIGGLAAAAVLFGYTWWAPIVLGGAWLATHWWLRESAVWQDRNTDEVRAAQRDADYTYRLAVDPAPAKELRLFGLVGWTIDRFVNRRAHLHALQYEATRLRERPMLWSLLLVLAANIVVFWSLADAANAGRITLAEVVVFAQAAVGTSMIAFGGLSWALDGSAAPVAAVLRLEAAMAAAGALASGTRTAAGLPARDVRFRDVTFAYPGGSPVLDHFDLTIPAGSSMAIVGQNGAGKTTLAKLLCRLYDPQAGAIEADGIDLRDLELKSWRERVTAVFQDFVRFELSLRDNVAPSGAPDEVVQAALQGAGAGQLAGLDTVLARGYEGGTDLRAGSGSAWRSRERSRPCSWGLDWCCSTSPRLNWMCAAKQRSSIASSWPPATARRSSSRTASRPCARPTASACSSRAASSSSARTTSSWRAAAAIRRCSTCRRNASTPPRTKRGRAMTSSPEPAQDAVVRPVRDDLPPALSSMWRLCKLGYRHEPRLMLVAFVLSLLSALPDALLAWLFKLLGDGVLEQDAFLLVMAATRPRRLGHGDVVPPDSEHAPAAPLPRQGHDRPRIARRPAAGVDRNHRASRTPRLSRSALDAPPPGVRPRSHVHVGVLHLRVDPAARGDGRPAHVHPSRARPARRVCRYRPCSRRRGGPRSSAWPRNAALRPPVSAATCSRWRRRRHRERKCGCSASAIGS